MTVSIFHSSEFVRLNDLALIERGNAKLLIGPERGTYGGFADAYDLETMAALLDDVPRACTIKLAPASHDLALFSRSMNALHRAGFMVEHVDLNYERRPLNIAFADELSDGARKKLAKCNRAGYRGVLLDRRQWREAYQLLAANRARAGRKLSLPFQRIIDLEDALHGAHLFFGTFDGKRMAAAAICLRVRSDILMCYAWGDAEKNEFAPTVQLCQRIYEEACFMSCRLLDVGISTEAGVPNVGLINFKQGLGFLPSVKITMRRA